MLLANSLLQVRGPREPEYTDFLKAQPNNQMHWSNALGLVPGDESRTAEPPVGFSQGVNSLIVVLNSHYRLSPLNGTLSIQMAGEVMSVWVVFASL